MKKYEIVKINVTGEAPKYLILDNDSQKWFCGYDFMGSVDWKLSTCADSYLDSRDEAEAIVADLEAANAEQEDPIIKSLQTTLDYAYNRRDDEWKAYDSLRISEKPHLGMLDSLYNKYREAQSFLEGVTMAIFAAGYALTTENEGRSKVCKK